MNLTEGTTLLHNPRCSKCRIAVSMLEERGQEFRVREYLEDPLSRVELEQLHGLLGRPPMEWTRTGEPEWAETGLSDDASSEDVLEAIAAAPKLLQRPILISGGAATIGRPPERILALLEG